MPYLPVMAERPEQAHLSSYTLRISWRLFWILVKENSSFLRISGQESCSPASGAFPGCTALLGEDAPLSPLEWRQPGLTAGGYEDI